MDVISAPQSPKKQINSFTPAQLRMLVHGAQANDAQAIGTLCAAFKPLIYKESSRPLIRNTLGEDAVNTAWIVFLELIGKYKGSKFSHLPGLLSLHVRYALYHAAIKHIKDHDYDSLDMGEAGEQLLQIADLHDHIEASTTQQLLHKALSKLSKTQRLVIEELYIKGQTPKHCEIYGISKQACYMHKTRALKKLRKLITE